MRVPLWAVVLLLFVVVLGATWLIHREQQMQSESPAVLLQVRQLQQLATVKYTVQKVVGVTDPKPYVGSESILLIVQASVEAGIDLSRLTAEDISRRADGSVAIRIPPAKIFNVAIDEKGTKVWDRQKTWWTPWVPYSLDLEQRARAEGLKAAEQSALTMGILQQAEENARHSIRSLLGLAGVKAEVVIGRGGKVSRLRPPARVRTGLVLRAAAAH